MTQPTENVRSERTETDCGKPILSCAVESIVPRAVRFDPDARAFEAFNCGTDFDTRLLDPLAATTLKEALAETTSRWAWDRGSRLAVREIGEKIDLLHVYAVRRSGTGGRVWHGHVPSTEYSRWLDHICTIDLHVIAGVNLKAVGCEIDIHKHRQAQRPNGIEWGRS